MTAIPQNEKIWVDDLRKKLSGPLPGVVAQYKMASRRRIEELANTLPDVPENARVAAILNLLFFDKGAWRTVLIHRTENPNDRHSRQVSFPGGRHEASDRSLAYTALREAEEEIGIPREQIEIIGGLTQLYIPVSNYIVHPFVGVLKGKAEFFPQTEEVDAIITPSIVHFSDDAICKVIDIRLENQIILKDTPYFDVEGRMVWGATAMILSEFLEVLKLEI